MSHPNTDPRIDELRRHVREELDQGRLEEAIARCDEAIALARELDSQELEDQAVCNRSGILIAQGKGDEVIRLLRRILLRSGHPAICFQAAYNVSQFHELRKEKERSLFYARLALDHSRKSALPECIASALNRVANLLLLDSYFEEACDEYRQALELLPEDRYFDRAVILTNLGYCEAVLGHFNQGIRYLFNGLRIFRERCAEVWQTIPHLALSYAYLELGKLDQAREHATVALRLSHRADSPEQVKTSLYLLGETEKQAGDDDAAYEYFGRLQEQFYPEDVGLQDLLMATDIRQLVNIMA